MNHRFCRLQCDYSGCLVTEGAPGSPLWRGCAAHQALPVSSGPACGAEPAQLAVLIGTRAWAIMGLATGREPSGSWRRRGNRPTAGDSRGSRSLRFPPPGRRRRYWVPDLPAWFLSQGLWASTAYRLTHYARYRRHLRSLSGLPFVARSDRHSIHRNQHLTPGDISPPARGSAWRIFVIGPGPDRQELLYLQGSPWACGRAPSSTVRPRTPLNNADRAGRSGGPRPVPGAVGSSAALIPPCLARRRGLGACRFPVPGVTGVLAGQASAQVPFWRVSPCRSRVRRLIAAHRVCSQASFLAAPR